MLQNIFSMNTIKETKQRFSGKFLTLLAVSILLTGVISLPGLCYILFGTIIKLWEVVGVSDFFYRSLGYIIVFCCFLSLVRITVTEVLFSKTLTFCIRLVGILLSVSAFIVPRLPDYQSSDFKLFRFGDFALINGTLLLPGFLLLILSELLKEAFRMQNEIEEIL